MIGFDGSKVEAREGRWAEAAGGAEAKGNTGAGPGGNGTQTIEAPGRFTDG